MQNVQIYSKIRWSYLNFTTQTVYAKFEIVFYQHKCNDKIKIKYTITYIADLWNSTQIIVINKN